MNNLDWLCENDREQLMKLLTGGDSCEYCAFDAEYDCGNRCNWGMQIWLKTEHNDGSAPENGVSAEGGDSNDGKPDIDASGRIPTEQAAENLAGNMKRLNGILGQSFSETYRNYHELGKLGEKPSVESCGGDADTREKLENDIHEFKLRHARDYIEFIAFDTVVRGWLDRQAAITERELCKGCDWPYLAAQPDQEAYDRIAELEAELEKRDKGIARLKAQRDEARAEREALRKKLGEAISHAQAIAGLAEVDR